MKKFGVSSSPLPSFLDSSFKILYIPGEIQAFCSYADFGYITHYLLTIFFPDPLQEAGKAWEAPSTLSNLSGYYFPSGQQIASTCLSTRDQL